MICPPPAGGRSNISANVVVCMPLPLQSLTAAASGLARLPVRAAMLPVKVASAGAAVIGGAFGAVSLGFLAAYPLLAGQRKGLFYGGGFAQLGVQVLGPVAVGLYSFTVAWILGKIIDKTMGFRVSAEDEVTGVDLTQHAETAYEFGSIHLGHTPGHAVTDADQEVTDRESEPVIRAR